MCIQEQDNALLITQNSCRTAQVQTYFKDLYNYLMLEQSIDQNIFPEVQGTARPLASGNRSY